MATRGRKPKPPELHVLNGDPGRRHAGRVTPKSDRSVGDPPAHFTAQQKRDWRQVARNAPPGVLTATDRGPLIAWVVAHDTHREAVKAVQQYGHVTEGSQGSLVVSPWVRIQDRQAELMLRASSELGFTPSARARVSGITQQAPAAGKFANNGVS